MVLLTNPVVITSPQILSAWGGRSREKKGIGKEDGESRAGRSDGKRVEREREG